MVERYRNSLASRMFDFVNHILLSLFMLIVLLPIAWVILNSFATNAEIDRGAIIPTQYTLDAYRSAFSTPLLVNGYLISVFVTVVGTITSMIVTVMLAYALSKKNLPGRRVLLFFVVLTMIINVGLIPYYLIVKSLHLLDSIWSLIIPSALNAFNVILMKNFFLTIPDELEDAARLDGCSDFAVLTRIVLPLSKPALAAFSLFYAVGYWNTYFNAVLFINDPAKMPLQVVLRQMFSVEYLPQQDIVKLTEMSYPQTLRAAAVVLSVIPVLLIYPWVQRHFTEGMLVGSVKE